MPIHNHIVRDAHGRPDAAGLIACGVLLSVEIGVHPSLAKKATPGPPVFGKALVDTGATSTAIDRNVPQRLGLSPAGARDILTPNGRATAQLYAVELRFPGIDLPSVPSTQVAGVTLAELGLVALIGRDMLSRFVVTYNGPLGLVTLAH